MEIILGLTGIQEFEQGGAVLIIATVTKGLHRPRSCTKFYNCLIQSIEAVSSVCLKLIPDSVLACWSIFMMVPCTAD